MNSLKAFLSPCESITTTDALQRGKLSVLTENEQPVQVFDRAGQPQSFQIVSIVEPESLTQEEVAILTAVAEQSKWIVVVDQSGRVCGVIEPEGSEELWIAARATVQPGELSSAVASPLYAQTISPSNLGVTWRHSLREWWHQVLKDHGQYQCYAFFLCLPSDRDAIEYVIKYGKELDALSGKNCLLIFLSKVGFRRTGYDKAIWNVAINEHIREGYSVTIANLFKINYIDLPCLVLFRTIHSPQRVVFSFKGLDVDSLARKMREIFAIIQQAIASGQDPVSALERYQGRQRLKQAGLAVLTRLCGFAGKTFEAAVEEWIKVSLR
ncbi:MAG: hypothetical protein QXS54_07445 [Candidatus Methanomethylicaceae archaeon]